MKSLNYIVIRNKEFFLDVGDQFKMYREGYISYYPSTVDNIIKLPSTGSNWSNVRSVNLPNKYHKVLKNADNITFNETDNTFTVNSVEKVEIKRKDFGDLYYVGIKVRDSYNDKNLFTIKKAKIKKETEKQFILENDLCYRSIVNKTDANIITGQSRYRSSFLCTGDDYGVFCKFDDFDNFRDQLVEKMKIHIQNMLKKAHEDLEILNSKLEKEGYCSLTYNHL